MTARSQRSNQEKAHEEENEVSRRTMEAERVDRVKGCSLVRGDNVRDCGGHKDVMVEVYLAEWVHKGERNERCAMWPRTGREMSTEEINADGK